MRFSAVLTHRVRGFRVFDLAALAVLLVLALTVYAFKTFAGDQRADIVDVENQIHDEGRRVRLLKAELAQLQSPTRLEALARHYADQAPVTAPQEVTPEALPQAATTLPRQPATAPAAPAAPVAATTDPKAPPAAESVHG
jgi:hypothetical protein